MNKELKEAEADRKFWKEEIGDPLGLMLVGWTYRQSALFSDNNGHTINIERWFANQIINTLESYAEGWEGG